MMKRLVYSSIFSMAVFSCLLLQAETNIKSTDKMEQFKNAHPEARFSGSQYFDGEGFFEQHATSNMIYGTVLATGTTAEASAWNFYDQIDGIYADEVGKLVPAIQANGENSIGVMWDRQKRSHRFQVMRFNQTIGGIPVFRSGIGFLVRNENQFPVVMSSNNLKELAGFELDAQSAAKPVEVSREMIAGANEVFKRPSVGYDGEPRPSSVLQRDIAQQQPATRVTDEQLVVWAGVSNERVGKPELAVTFTAERGVSSNPDQHRLYFIVAALDDGEILLAENLVSSLDVNGTVSGQASDGMGALECHSAASFALPYAHVEIVGGQSVYADANGNFNIPDNSNGPVTVRSRLEGQFFNLNDNSTNTTPSITVSANEPGTVDLLHNPNPSQFSTAAVNCYLHANIVRDFVLSFEPSFPTINNQTGFNIEVNINASCNATYGGNVINFFRNAGGCNNTSIPSVIYHEYGHHLVAVTGNGQGQFGEGTGDTVGVLVEDFPGGGIGFFGDCDNPARSAENFRTYPCSGGIHDCGQLISGCVWDTINEIRKTDPVNARDITAELFFGMLIVRGQMSPGSTTIGPEVTLIFLELDDDDGNIGNGTPHYQEIADAFNAHNMMAPELELLAITFPNGTPDQIAPGGGTQFDVDVQGVISSPVAGSGILHVDRGSGFEQFGMTANGGASYTAEFPITECGNEVKFYVSFEAVNGAVVTAPQGAPANALVAISATGLLLDFSDSFESDLGWAVSGNATDGQWERAIPNNGDRGDPSEDVDVAGLGFCFVTDNGNTGGNTNTDVDGGSTILTTPVLDATSVADATAFASYFRWFDNNDLGPNNDDTLLIEISNNGGASWTNLETVGPTGADIDGGWVAKQIRIADFVAPTNNMRFRFTASDVGSASIVEAGIDAFQITFVECADDVLHGDVNLDGEVNLLDVGPFVAVLSSGGFQAEADVNKDGVVDLLDVQDFVSLLSGA